MEGVPRGKPGGPRKYLAGELRPQPGQGGGRGGEESHWKVESTALGTRDGGGEGQGPGFLRGRARVRPAGVGTLGSEDLAVGARA